MLGGALCCSHLALIAEVHSPLEERKHGVYDPVPPVPNHSRLQTVTGGQSRIKRDKCEGAGQPTTTANQNTFFSD